MTIPRKAIFSLIISAVGIAVFSVFAFTGLFNLIESRFYNPSVTKTQLAEIEQDARNIRGFFMELEGEFSRTLDNEAVKRSFLPEQSSGDIFERSKIFGLLIETRKGLQSVRFVDIQGQRVHFSTNPADILNQAEGRLAYKNYPDLSPDASFEALAAPENSPPRIIFDSQNDRIVFSFPFHDSLGLYRGTALYSLSARALSDRMIVNGRLRFGETAALVDSPQGVLLGISGPDGAGLAQAASSVWADRITGISYLSSNNSGASLVLVSARTDGTEAASSGIFTGRVVPSSFFTFPLAMKIILILALFLTLYLILFLCFNFRADTFIALQNRLKELELSLIREYYDRKGDVDWNRWKRELESRREEVKAEIKRGFKVQPALENDVNTLINKSWDELVAAIGGQRPALNEDKLEMLSRLMSRSDFPANFVPPQQTGPSENIAPTQSAAVPAAHFKTPADGRPEDKEEAEELEELEELEEFETPEEVETLEPLEEVEELEALEPLEEADKLEEFESPEEAEELEPLEEANEPEALEPPEEADGLEELEALTPETPMEVSAAEVPADELEEPHGGFEEIELLDGLEPLEGTGKEVRRPDPDEQYAVEIEWSENTGGLLEPDGGGIEFDESPLGEEAELAASFEIVSPFNTVLSGIERPDETQAGELEELPAEAFMYRLFQDLETGLETLDCEESAEAELIDMKLIDVIEEKDGISYVSASAQKPDEETEQSLDPELKDLVSSVIG